MGSQRWPGTRANKLCALIGINAQLFSNGQPLTESDRSIWKVLRPGVVLEYVILIVGRVHS